MRELTLTSPHVFIHASVILSSVVVLLDDVCLLFSRDSHPLEICSVYLHTDETLIISHHQPHFSFCQKNDSNNGLLHNQTDSALSDQFCSIMLWNTVCNFTRKFNASLSQAGRLSEALYVNSLHFIAVLQLFMTLLLCVKSKQV